MTRFLVTGANGFLGTALTRHLVESGHQVVASVRDRRRTDRLPGEARVVEVASLGPDTDWSMALQEVQVVVHLAARVHRMDEDPQTAEREHHRANAEGTRALMRQAAEAGVRRSLLASSIKAMGEETAPGKPWTPESPCHPQDAYGRSKRAAEEELVEVCRESGMEHVILRLPLVYGPRVRGNFLAMLERIARRRPVPAGISTNRRSLLGLGNFCSSVAAAAASPAAAGQVFLPSDGEPLSTGELLHGVADALGVPVRSVPVPAFLLRALFGSRGRRLTSSAEVDSSSLSTVLDWSPPHGVEEELARTAAWYWAVHGGGWSR